MAVGALVTQGVDDDRRHRDASPCLVWEWLVIEALYRQLQHQPELWGVPGTLVAQRVPNHHGYFDGAVT